MEVSALQAQAPRGAAPKIDKSSAYYHYALAHMYAEQASMYGNRGDYVNKAIENYKEAIKADPTAAMLSEELSDLYVQSGRLREAQTDAEDVLKQNPNDLNAHRLLARIFTRLVGDGRSGKVDETMLRRATEAVSEDHGSGAERYSGVADAGAPAKSGGQFGRRPEVLSESSRHRAG